MTGEEVFNVIRDLIEVSEISRNTNPKYPQYVKYFVESGDKKSLDYLSYSITVIENHLDNLKKYANVINYLSNENRFIFNSYSVTGAFMEIRDFCKVRMNYCPDEYKSQWSYLYDRIHKIVITLSADLSKRSTFNVHINGQEYHADLMIDGYAITDNDDIMDLLQIVFDKYSNNHGIKIKMNWEEVKENGSGIRE